MFGDIASTLQSGNKQQFEAGKKFASVQALISTHEGAQKAFSALAGIPIIGPQLGIAAAIAATAAGLTRVSSINSQSFQAHDGIDSFPSTGSFTGNMERGEMIINKGNSEGIRQLAKQGLNQDREVSGGSISLTININSPMFNPDWDELAEAQIKPAMDRIFRRDIFLEGVQYSG
jgi:hypothetical protein